MTHINPAFPAHGDPNWDAPLNGALGAIVTQVNIHDDLLIAQDVTNPASAASNTLAGMYLPFWRPNTTYVQGQRIVNPSGQTVTAKTNFTSGSVYDPNNWTIAAGSAVSDANSSTKGVVQLSGDLGGTAASPTVPALPYKVGSADQSILQIVKVTQAQYDALNPKVATTLYIISG